ncbi:MULTISPECIES: hypothetical protein [Sphingomonas]|uniref:hypothetical protein n=1 Tax=Sphingomonadales TaxID=204457 RepID=UPI000A71B8A8|nr:MULTISPECIES: hypothetical protein [Sphingomonas]
MRSIVMDLSRDTKDGTGPMHQAVVELTAPPRAGQGVGDALRQAYRPEMAEIPAEWRQLIRQLD